MIFFVHIGKTAGSTLNRYLADSLPRGFVHCEAFIHNPAVLPQRLAEAAWLSGHVAQPVAEARLAPFVSGVRYFTCIRRPLAQVRSHYNWLVEIFHKSPEFYAAHPAQIRAISEAVRETVAAPTPAAVAGDLRRFAGLFLNCQSRYFLGGAGLATLPADIGPLQFVRHPRVRRRIAAFEAIGESDRVEVLANHILGEARYAAGNLRKENASRYHFDPALFESDEVEETLRVHNRFDELLYGHLTRRMTDGILVNPARPDLPVAAEGEVHG